MCYKHIIYIGTQTRNNIFHRPYKYFFHAWIEPETRSAAINSSATVTNVSSIENFQFPEKQFLEENSVVQNIPPREMIRGVCSVPLGYPCSKLADLSS